MPHGPNDLILLMLLKPSRSAMVLAGLQFTSVRLGDFSENDTLEDVVDRLCDTINSLSNELIKSITGRDWILSLL